MLEYLISSEEKVNPFYFVFRILVLIGMVICSWKLIQVSPFEEFTFDGLANFFHRPNLAFHEAGHVIFRPFGELMMFFGGSLSQFLVPFILMIAFWYHNRDTFGAAAMLWWAGENLMDIAPYIGDARDLELVLIGGKTGREVNGHDWENILDRLNALHLDDEIAMKVFFIGKVLLIFSCIWALLSLIHQKKKLDW